MTTCTEPDARETELEDERSTAPDRVWQTETEKSCDAAPPADTAMPRILLAEDNGEMRQLLAGQLRLAGYEVVECRDGEQLVERLASTFLPTRNRHGFDLVVSDIRMPGFSGLEVLDGLHDCEDFPPMILITAFGDQATHARARLLGAAATLDKPFRIPELLAIVQRQIERRRRGWRTGATAAPSSLDITPPSPSDPHDNVNHEED